MKNHAKKPPRKITFNSVAERANSSDTGIANGIYAQNAEGYINCFVNIVKVNKKDIPENIENIYHRK